MNSKHVKRVDLIFEKDRMQGCSWRRSLKWIRKPFARRFLDSDLKGRGGAGFPTGMKWRFTASEKDPVKYIVCNADEGEPGTFKDREILDQVPGKVFCGMAIAGRAVGAKKGYVYLRGEYKFLIPKLNE